MLWVLKSPWMWVRKRICLQSVYLWFWASSNSSSSRSSYTHVLYWAACLSSNFDYDRADASQQCRCMWLQCGFIPAISGWLLYVRCEEARQQDCYTCTLLSVSDNYLYLTTCIGCVSCELLLATTARTVSVWRRFASLADNGNSQVWFTVTLTKTETKMNENDKISNSLIKTKTKTQNTENGDVTTTWK